MPYSDFITRPHKRSFVAQLAVITPYAQFTFDFACRSGASAAAIVTRTASTGRSDFSFVWKRRSATVPRPPTEVKHHPSSVNDLLVKSLMEAAKPPKAGGTAGGGVTLLGFLSSSFSSIDRALATRLVTELGAGFEPTTPVSTLDAKAVHQVTRLLAQAQIPPPSGDCLSPAGEYNLRLGIMKELRPDLVATTCSPVGVYEGHPFIVEVGVALGGRGADGLTVHRFANRIPLLFEGGADVATRTATTRIPWASYKIDPAKVCSSHTGVGHNTVLLSYHGGLLYKRCVAYSGPQDKVGVFVSIVSTKIPFKGTGKEYIGASQTRKLIATTKELSLHRRESCTHVM